jgi:predicted AAA+ superfamily ATPase
LKRLLYDKLLEWKNGANRKPLLLQGARQVGKTYLVKEFGNNEYDDLVYLNFEEEPELISIFRGSLKAGQILESIGLLIGTKVDCERTLIFFDEAQVFPEVITSLKYFYEQAPQCHVIAAGSLLGVSVSRKKSFPVGKVNFLTLYPMSFMEYLLAEDEELIVEKLTNKGNTNALPEIIHDKLLGYLKKYLFLGGMPEVVKTYLEKKDIRLAREIQNDILESYKRDFSKYASKTDAIKISEVWRSLPAQLSKENKKFKFSEVRKKARASLYEGAIEWLRQAGLINIAYNVKLPKLPLSGYADYDKFKVYLLDNGLLGAMLNVSSDIIIKPNELFQEYNGAFIENYVASELAIKGYQLFYWTSKSDAEVDFIVQNKNEIYPLEVKSGMSRNIKSLRSYASKYSPKLLIRTSPRNYVQAESFINIPLYVVESMERLIEDKEY